MHIVKTMVAKVGGSCEGASLKVGSTSIGYFVAIFRVFEWIAKGLQCCKSHNAQSDTTTQRRGTMYDKPINNSTSYYPKLPVFTTFLN